MGNEALRTLAVSVELCVSIGAEDVTEEQMDAFIEGNTEALKRAIEKFLSNDNGKETEAGWVDENHDAIIYESHDPCVLNIMDVT